MNVQNQGRDTVTYKMGMSTHTQNEGMKKPMELQGFFQCTGKGIALFVAITAPVNHSPYHWNRGKTTASIPQQILTSEQSNFRQSKNSNQMKISNYIKVTS